ncbi:MAG: oxidoreductase [Anaerolineae bacterium]|nr:oxidoreductase [Anaerolineae bacterium]
MQWSINDIPDQSGKTAIVTGANSGLGYETALALALKGARVVMACRNLDKGREALEAIQSQVAAGAVQLMALDLSSLASIEEFAVAYQAEHDRLDILINNAGVMAPPYQTTTDGFELQIGTNHLGHFALTGLLIGLIRQTPGCRIVTVTSMAQDYGTIKFDDINSKKSYSRYGAYCQSKLANVLFAFELQRRLDEAEIEAVSTAAHPGLSYTNLQKNTVKKTKAPLEGLIYGVVMPLLSQSQAQGAWPQLYAATMPQVNGGQHFGPGGLMALWGAPKKLKAAKAAYNEADASRLWDLSEQLTGVHYL